MSGTSALMLTNRGYPTPEVSAIFAKNGFDWQTLPTLTSMPSGGSISRSGQAMLYDSTGKLTYAPNNLLLRSQEFDNAAWFKSNSSVIANVATAPDGTTTADKIIENNTSNVHFIYSANYVGTNIVLIASVYAKASEREFINLQIGNFVNSAISYNFNLSTGVATSVSYGPDYTNFSASAVAVGGGWYRVSITATKGASVNTSNYMTIGTGQASSVINYAGDGTSGALIWGAQLEQATYQTTPSTYVATTTAAYYGPRFDYNPSTLAAKGLLIEGTRTNLATYSEQFDNAVWAKTNSTISANATTAPDGTVTADKLVENTATANHVMNRSNTITVAANTLHTLTVYAKAAERTSIQLLLVSGTYMAGVSYFFNLSNGTVSAPAITGSTAIYSSSITSVGNGWYRCVVTAIVDTTSTSINWNTSILSGTSTTIYTGDGTSGLFIWGAQLEVGAFSSSYIPTVASTVARAAETFAITGYSSSLINAYYIDEETGVSSSLPYNAGVAPSPSFSWLTSLRPYTNAFASSIASPSWLSFSRAGNAMITDSTGELTYAPNNLLLNTATLSTQSVTTAAIRYVLSFKGTGSVALSGAFTGSLAGTGASNRVSLAFTSTAASLTLTVTGTVTEAQLEAVTYETQPSLYVANTSAAYYGPRYDYDASTIPATPRGLLIEEARANLLTYSEQFDNANWAKIGATVSANSTMSPDGTSTADTITLSAASSGHYIFQTFTSSAVATTATVFAKYTNNKWLALRLFDGTNAYHGSFDIQNGVAGAKTASATTSVTACGNGWYRLSLTATLLANASSNVLIGVNNADLASIVTWTSTGTETAYIWGAQLEAGSFATSYIPTTTASVTRAADVSFSTSISSWYNTTASTAIVQYNIPYAYPAASFPVLNSFSDGTLSNTNKLFLIGSILNAAFQNSLVGSVNIGRINATPTFTAGQPNRAAMAYKINDRAVTANGTTPATAATSPYLGSTTRLSIGTDEVGTSQINGWIQSFAYYNQRLPDAVLKTKSAVNAPY